MVRRTSTLLLLLAVFIAYSVLILAQSPTTGSVTGLVTDPNNAAVAGAVVTVTNPVTGFAQKVITDGAGNYAAPLLPPGIYRLTVTSAGFNAPPLDVRVAITETTVVNVSLGVAGVIADPIVIEFEPLVQRNGPQLGRVVDSHSLSELPLATRNYSQILGLSPGTATYLPDNTAVGRNSQSISVNGARVTQNNVQINGVDVNTLASGAATTLATPAPETIHEFKVLTSLYDATLGRSGGGNIQTVTRSGSNNFHGAAYEYFRNDALNANNAFLKAVGVKRPKLNRNVFGATLGGPIKQDRRFFFISYQGSRELNSAAILNSLSSNVLIASGLTNDRSGPTLILTFRPILPSGQQATVIDPTALALLNFKLANGNFLIPTPQSNGRYTGSAPSRFREDQFNSNLDYRVNEQNWLTLKFFFSNAPSTIALPSLRGAGANVSGFGNDQLNDHRLVVIQDLHTFTPNVFNEARLGYNFLRNVTSAEEAVNDSEVGIKRSNADRFPGLPLLRIAPAAGGVIIGTQSNIGPAVSSVTTLADTLSLIHGRHSMRIGFEIRHNQINTNLNQFVRGQIDFANFNNFLIGLSSVSIFGSGVSGRSWRATDYNFFVQDDWKVSSKLTINLGLRYELDQPQYDTRGRLSTFDPTLYQPRLQVDNSGNPVGPPVRGFVQAGNVIPEYDLPDVPNVSKTVLTSNDPNNFAPRVGFAYSPLSSGRLVVRGGYGIFYSRATVQYGAFSVAVPPTYILGRRTNAPTATPFFAPPPESDFPTFVPGVALAGSFFDRGIRTPYFQQYNAGIQYEVFKGALLELAYVGTRGLNLFRQLAINQARLASPQSPVVNAVTGATITTNTPANAQLRAPFQGVETSGFFQNQSTAQSSYNSLQASLTKRLSKGLQFLASYTYARSIDNASGQGGGAGINGVVNPGAVGDTSNILNNQIDNRANRGVSDFDRTHRFVLSYLWDLPALAAKSTRGRWLLADWQLAGIVVGMSGLPIDIVDSGAGSLYGLSAPNALARPNYAKGVSSNSPVGYFFDPFAFARPTVLAGQLIPSSRGTATAGATGTDFGDVGRNVLRGPGQVNVDFSVIKRLPIGERKNIEFRTEFFNLFNHVNFANPISDLNAVASSGGTIDPNTGRIINPGDFGRIISTSNNPRLIQFALKFNF